MSSIKTRVSKLEQQRPVSAKKGPIELIGVQTGETKETALERWMKDNPGREMPEDIIYLVPFEQKTRGQHDELN
ncbi:hypothetical protein [Methylobacter marinus]|jgi:hypothetical protein|uniref:hypothetical protein n=1 Tax=Methylobacter marinus TaxID=34058 RepID=UPI00037168F2|nr:hypothetical protein [Methylobacter marinus]